MHFSRFEKLVLAIGATTILGSLFLSLPNGAIDPIEIFAQAALLGVLFFAVRYGRRGGLIAAVIASGLYVVLRLPMINEVPIPAQTLALVASRVLAFGIVGVVGGDICARLKYSMTRLEGGSAIDEWSRVYNERYMHTELEQAVGRFRRYDEKFSVIVVTMSPALFAGFTPARTRTLIRGIADHIRGDLRMVDEVARLDDGRFVILLPHTPKEGGNVVAARISTGVRSALGARDEAVTVQCHSATDDLPAIEGLLETTLPPTPEGDQEASVA